jgi:transcriptional regulator with XRE-family HTH domain
MSANLLFGMLTSQQCRMARAALAWGVRDLASRAEVGPSTVHNFERGYTKPNRSTLAAIRRAFEAAGIEFIDANGDGPGVRVKRKEEN